MTTDTVFASAPREERHPSPDVAALCRTVVSLAHPAANAFPLMIESDLRSLAHDIAVNGLREPLCKDADGLLVDGRNRWVACQMAGVEAKALSLPPDIGVVAYVVSHNLRRRNLTPSQLAACAAELANIRLGHNQHQPSVDCPEGQPSMPITQPQAARLLGVGRRLVVDVARVRHNDPELFERVKKGEIKVGAALREVNAKKPPARKSKPRPVEPQTPDHIARLRLWLTSGARLAAEFPDVPREWAAYGHLLSLDDIDEILSFVTALSAATKAVRAA